MKRLIWAAVLTAAMLLLSHARASALIEFCPAGLQIAPVGQDLKSAPAPASLYGFELGALGPPIVSATLAFDTSQGWFTLDVPAMALLAKDRHYANPSSTFVRRDWVGPVMYVRFPSDVKISRSWVYSAKAQNDGAFGWEK